MPAVRQTDAAFPFDPRFFRRFMVGRHFTFYRAYVHDNNDPRRAGRLRLRIPQLLGRGHGEVSVSDWTRNVIQLFGGQGDFGVNFIPPIGAKVWVICDLGDPQHLLWIGGWVRTGREAAGGSAGSTLTKGPVLPDWTTLARGGGREPSAVPILPPPAPDPSTQIPKGTGVVIPPVEAGIALAPGMPIPEPPTPYATEYPHNRVVRFGNTTVEFDDTPGAERFHLWFSPPKGLPSYIEMHPDGRVCMRRGGDTYEVHEGNLRVQTKGTVDWHVLGDFNLHVAGTMRTLVDTHRFETTLGNWNVSVGGITTWALVQDVIWTFGRTFTWTVARTANWIFTGALAWTTLAGATILTLLRRWKFVGSIEVCRDIRVHTIHVNKEWVKKEKDYHGHPPCTS